MVQSAIRRRGLSSSDYFWSKKGSMDDENLMMPAKLLEILGFIEAY
jgi:hypothetical protein